MNILKIGFDKTRQIALLVFIVALLLVPQLTQAATHVISSLPYSVSQRDHSADAWDTLVFSSSHLTSNTDGILFGGDTHNWLILLGDDTLSFGRDSTYRPGVYTGARGVAFNYTSYDNVLKGGYILHSPSNITGFETSYNPNDTLNSYNSCINISGAHDILIDSVRKAIVYGFNSHTATGGAYNITFRNSTLINRCHIFDSRCMFRTTCYKREFSHRPVGDQFSVRFYGSTLESYSHAGIYIYGKNNSQPIVQIEACTLKIDMRNYMYTDYDGTCHSTTNGYCVQFTMGGPGSYIKDNYMYAGSQYTGGRGIFINATYGSAEAPIEISGNYIDMHEGYNVEFSPNIYAPCGIKIRQESRHLWIHDNIVVQTSDLGHPEQGAYHYNGEPIVYQVWDDAPTPPYNITIENNICSSLVITPNSGADYMVSGAKFDFCIEEDTSFHWRNNFIYSQGNHGYDYGQYDGPSSYIIIENDIIEMDPVKIPDQHTFNVGDYRGCYENEANDMTYLGNASPYSVSHYFQGGPTGGSADQEISVNRTIDVRVIDNNGYNVEDALVTVINGYGNTVLSGTTTRSGKVSGKVTYFYSARVIPDSVSYNNFTVLIEKGTDSYTKDFEINETFEMPACTLFNSSGILDTIPPDPVDDLGALPGPFNGTAVLFWSATGDDGMIGNASHYIIKYSQQPITANSFDGLATVVGSPPLPIAPGGSQTDTVRGLSAGEEYYFAMKVYDYVNQASGLSNIVSCTATVSISSGGEETDYLISDLNPNNGVELTTQQPTLSALNVSGVGPNSYYFEVADNSNFNPVLVSSPGVPQDNDSYTDWQVSQVLPFDDTYFWRVRVNDNPYSSVYNFSLSATATSDDAFVLNPYPNPVSFNQGETVTFLLPDEPTELFIQTINGETIRLEKALSGTWEWDGTNESGKRVAVGEKYLWYVLSGSNHSEGIIVTIP